MIPAASGAAGAMELIKVLCVPKLPAAASLLKT
jgi:hypothetical protein